MLQVFSQSSFKKNNTSLYKSQTVSKEWRHCDRHNSHRIPTGSECIIFESKDKYFLTIK